MSDPFVLAIGLLTTMQTSPIALKLTPPDWFLNTSLAVTQVQLCDSSVANPNTPHVEIGLPEFTQTGNTSSSSRLPQQLFESYPPESLATSDSATNSSESSTLRSEETPDLVTYSRSASIRPLSGPQMYQQRLAALSAGKTYTRLAADSFWPSWADARQQPTYEQWKWLLSREATAIAKGQGSNRLAVLLGDSISMWFPQERLPSGRLWLNQGISGDTSGGILRRLSLLSHVRPDSIYILAGINDLRRGLTDHEILWNHRQILHRLRQAHPQAQIILQSILPTRLAAIPHSRIRHINQELAAIAQQEGAIYLDIYSQFTDEEGNLRRDLTTDGLHLNVRGYEVWEWALERSESWIALYGGR